MLRLQAIYLTSLKVIKSEKFFIMECFTAFRVKLFKWDTAAQQGVKIFFIP